MQRASDILAESCPEATFGHGVAQLTAQDSLESFVRRADQHRREQQNQRHLRAATEASVVDLSEAAAIAPATAPGSVACGRCATRISLGDFVVVQLKSATRVADCPRCGETTIIRLANTRW
jgi:predicted RNA-binding Zn-ribbon protein involved in translation (DUF1610 family)